MTFLWTYGNVQFIRPLEIWLSYVLFCTLVISHLFVLVQMVENITGEGLAKKCLYWLDATRPHPLFGPMLTKAKIPLSDIRPQCVQLILIGLQPRHTEQNPPGQPSACSMSFLISADVIYRDWINDAFGLEATAWNIRANHAKVSPFDVRSRGGLASLGGLIKFLSIMCPYRPIYDIICVRN